MCSASTHTSQRGTCSLGYNRTITLALAIGAFLAMVYLLTFSGQFRSIDEYAMYARTESLAQGHGFYIPDIFCYISQSDRRNRTRTTAASGSALFTRPAISTFEHHRSSYAL